ncbi:MAG: 3-oxoadipate enol-lactonase [Spirosomataceae bacterium]
MPQLQTRTGITHYQLEGSADAPVLMFSNSLGSDLSMWDPQLQMLTEHFRVLRYDTRGHGQSEVSRGPYTIDQVGQDVVALLDALGIQKINFCGLSMGGLIGQWLGINHPGRLHKLVLSNTGAKIGQADKWNQRIATISAHGMASIVDETIERWFTTPFIAASPSAIAHVRAMFLANQVEGYTACCAVVRDADFRNQLEQISVPTLVIAGTHDPATTVADGEFLATHIPNAVLSVVPAAHLSNIEMGDLYSAKLLAFLG